MDSSLRATVARRVHVLSQTIIPELSSAEETRKDCQVQRSSERREVRGRQLRHVVAYGDGYSIFVPPHPKGSIVV